MTWFRIDDGFESSPKVVAIPRGATRLRAVGLWTSVGVWCARTYTDGLFAPEMITEQGGTKTDAAHLIRVGLWHKAGEGCDTDTCPAGVEGMLRIHDYLEYNPSRAQKVAERAARAEAGRAGGKASGRSRREAKTKHGASGRLEPPTRPVPFPMAAAAEDPQVVDGEGAAPPPLPPAIEILRGALEARKLHVRWDRLTAEQITEVEHLIDVHGDGPLVASAVRDFQPNKPVAFAQAWLPSWRQLRRPGDLAAVATPCGEPGHTGTTTHCAQCASEQRAVPDDVADLRKRRAR